MVTSSLKKLNTNYKMRFGKFEFNLKRPHIMGILNLTPDSFSGDGCYSNSLIKGSKKKTKEIINMALKMQNDGADIIDIGGESSRPNAKPISKKEEYNRVIPILKLLVKKLNIPISIDTYKPEIANAALDCGAVIINDITALADINMVKTISRHKAGVILMHMKGNPLIMQKKIFYKNLTSEIINRLRSSIKIATDNGISFDKIIIDPGIGFGKTTKHNLEILSRLEEFKTLKRPILIGPSRKSFIGNILGIPPKERIYGTLASVIVALMKGANIVRVHDVKEIYQGIKILEKITNYADCN